MSEGYYHGLWRRDGQGCGSRGAGIVEQKQGKEMRKKEEHVGRKSVGGMVLAKEQGRMTAWFEVLAVMLCWHSGRVKEASPLYHKDQLHLILVS